MHTSTLSGTAKRSNARKSSVVSSSAVKAAPKYQQLAQRLRDEIASGQLRHGARLESLSEMHARYGATRPTVEKARDILEREGLIERVQGRGTFVTAAWPEKAATPSAHSNGVLQSTVAVLTIESAPHAQSGWAEYIGFGATKELRACGLHTLSLSPDGLKNGGLERLLKSVPSGVVVTDLLADAVPQELALALRESDVPVVVYGGDPQLDAFDRVTSDHEAGAYELARWLLAQGRTRIANVWPSPPLGYWYAQRYAGYERALREAGLKPLPPICVPDVAVSDDEAQPAFERKTRAVVGYLAEHLTGSEPLDALMVHTDGDCFATAAACRMCGRTPNRDVFIVGYDNYWAETPDREWETCAPIATVDKRNAELGGELVRLLLKRIAGELPATPQRRVVTPQLIVSP